MLKYIPDERRRVHKFLKTFPGFCWFPSRLYLHSGYLLAAAQSVDFILGISFPTYNAF